MTRSLSKGPFVDPKVFSSKTKVIWSRASSILPQFVGKTFLIHNGKSFVELQVQEMMIGHKFGEFALTRKKPMHKKKRKENNIWDKKFLQLH